MRKGQISIEVIFILLIVITLSAGILAQFLQNTQQQVLGSAAAREAIITELAKADATYYLQQVRLTQEEDGEITAEVFTNPALQEPESGAVRAAVKEAIGNATGTAQEKITVQLN